MKRNNKSGKKSTDKKRPNTNELKELSNILNQLAEIKNNNEEDIKPPKRKRCKKYECSNEKCTHKTSRKEIQLTEKFTNITTIDQLIELGELYNCINRKQYNNLNIRTIAKLIPILKKINMLVGLKNIKEQIVDQILYFTQGYHNNNYKCMNCEDCYFKINCMKLDFKSKDIKCDMLHTCITGKPGCGKTELAKLLAEIYYTIGILSTTNFNIYKRSDLIGEHLGETAIKTQECIDNSLNGVMFIDEIYSLGSDIKHNDSFEKECIDTLTNNLSEHRNFICIIAGYKDQVEKCFFSYNEGLNRRFAFRYHIEQYNSSELYQIFEQKVVLGNYKLLDIDKDKIRLLFSSNYNNFKNNGGDMETLFLNSKIIHCRQISCTPEYKYILIYNDIEAGIKILIKNRNIDNNTTYLNMFC